MPTSDPVTDPLADIERAAAAERREAAGAVDPQAGEKAGDKPPAKAKRTRGGKRPGAGRPAGTSNGQGIANLDKRLTELFGMVGLAVFAVNPADGAAIMENAEPIAKSLHALAKENAAVRRVLLGLLNTSAWGGVVMACAPLALQLARNHELLPNTGPLAGLAAAMGGGAGADPAGNGAAAPLG